jgi:hypothetical protein
MTGLSGYPVSCVRGVSGDGISSGLWAWFGEKFQDDRAIRIFSELGVLSGEEF